MIPRLLLATDLDAYVTHCAAHHVESGRDGEGYSGPYSRDEAFPIDGFRERTRARWERTLETPNWRRAWGIFDGPTLAASGNVAGGSIPADVHRVQLGLSVLRPYRRRGWGRAIVEGIIDWCRQEPTVAWLDLGVFGDNTAAQALFRACGFQEIGTVPDRWRVDGHRIDEILMTLDVSLVDGPSTHE